MSDDLLTISEAAERLRRKPRWLAEQARLRKVPSTRLGRSTFFTEAQIQQIVADGAVEAEDSAPAGITNRSLARQRAS